MKRIGAIILARLDSSRLPDKQLKVVRGKRVLDYVLERARRIRGPDEIVLATTSRPLDDPLEAFAKEQGLRVFRGQSENVSGRVLSCAHYFGFDVWVRINGDSPLLNYELFCEGMDIFQSWKYDIVTNVFERSFPVGNSVEIFSTDAFARGYEKMSVPEHFEHVTKYFYDNPSGFSIYNMQSGNNSLRTVHLAVDTQPDLNRFEWIMDRMGSDYLEYSGASVIDLYLQYEKQQNKSLSKVDKEI